MPGLIHLRRAGIAGAITLLLVAGSLTAVSAAGDVCVARYGAVITQTGTATCYADETSVAIARGDNAHAEAYNGSTAIATGNGANSYTDGDANTAVSQGEYAWSTAADGTENTAIRSGNNSEIPESQVIIGDSGPWTFGAAAVAGNGNTAIATGSNNAAAVGGGDNTSLISSGNDSNSAAIGYNNCNFFIRNGSFIQFPPSC